MTEEKIAQVHDPSSEVFSARERAALEFASVMSANDSSRADEVFAALRRHFDEPQIVELGFTVATLHGLNLFNNIFDIQPEAELMESRTGLDEPATDFSEQAAGSD